MEEKSVQCKAAEWLRIVLFFGWGFGGADSRYWMGGWRGLAAQIAAIGWADGEGGATRVGHFFGLSTKKGYLCNTLAT